SFSPSHSFFFTAPPTTEIYTLSLHDALPISKLFSARRDRDGRQRPLGHAPGPAPRRRPPRRGRGRAAHGRGRTRARRRRAHAVRDRKSTRLNSSHVSISYAVFCLKKKKKKSY